MKRKYKTELSNLSVISLLFFFLVYFVNYTVQQILCHLKDITTFHKFLQRACY